MKGGSRLFDRAVIPGMIWPLRMYMYMYVTADDGMVSGEERQMH